MASGPDPNSFGDGAKRDEATTKVPSKDPKKKDDKKEEDLVSSISHSLWIFAWLQELVHNQSWWRFTIKL